MENIKEVVLAFQAERLLRSNSKNALVLLEELFIEHDEYVARLINQIPQKQELIEVLNPLTEDRFKRARKKILDHLGDALRNLNNND